MAGEAPLATRGVDNEVPDLAENAEEASKDEANRIEPSPEEVKT